MISTFRLAAALFMMLPAAGLARTVPIPPANSIEVPDGWSSAPAPGGVEIATPDRRTRLRITIGGAAPAQIQAMVSEHQDHLASQGVTITGAGPERQMEQAGLRYVTSELAATLGGQRTLANLVIIGVPGRPDRAVVVTLWMGDFDVARRDMPAMGPAMDSLFASLARR